MRNIFALIPYGENNKLNQQGYKAFMLGATLS